jgi:hypothetical protein
MTDPCAECGFAWDTPVLDGLRAIERLPQDVRTLIATRDNALLERPAPEVWSPHEYIWHLADIFRLSAEWMHDIRTLDHPTHYAVDTDALAALRGYSRLPLETGLWSLEQSCGLFIAEAAVTEPTRPCYYHDWQDVTAAQVVSFLTHEAVHHLFDLRRQLEAREVNYAR